MAGYVFHQPRKAFAMLYRFHRPADSRAKLVCVMLLGSVAFNTTAIAGSIGASPERFSSADVTARVRDTQVLEFDVFLPLRNPAALEALVAAQQDRGSSQYHRWLSPSAFGARFGATDAIFAATSAELAAHGMRVERNARSLHVTATAAAIRAAFATELGIVAGPSGQRVVSIEGLHLTPALRSAGARIEAFSPSRYEAHPTSHVAARMLPDNRGSATGAYYYNDLKQAYAYPAVNAIKPGTTAQRLDGTGATIGVLMSADINDSDLAVMFGHENYTATTGLPAPTLYRRVLVNGGSNTSSSAFDEAELDTQMELGGAPGAHVVLYEIPSLSSSNIDAAYNKINQDNLVDAVSMSFGGCESANTTSALQQTHELFLQGNAQGITFLASSGDDSGLGCLPPNYLVRGGKFKKGASSPATDPAVTAVGGTNLITSYTAGSLDSSYVTENAYDDPEMPYAPAGFGAKVSGGRFGAGGGPSVYFATPSWQTATGVSKRTTPDIGMQVGGCPVGAYTPCNGGNTAVNGNGNTQRSYVAVFLNGTPAGLIGTSVSSPEFASVVALLVELHGRQGNLNPYLYSLRATNAYHTGIPGYNGIATNNVPSPTYNQTVGLGTPVTATLLGLPAGTSTAGTPQSVSNP